MLRDKNLIPLSHQHQHALALCVRIERAFASGSMNTREWQDEITVLFDGEIRYHFESEQQVLFPAARNLPPQQAKTAPAGDPGVGLDALVDELLIEHGLIRRYVERARKYDLIATDLQMFAATLSMHVRKEERQLFEEMQRQMGPEQMEALGEALDRYFEGSGMPGASCALRKPTL